MDTFPFVMHNRSPGHYAPKYKKAVMKFQIDVTFLGSIARLSRWYEGSVHDGTIYEDNFDGVPIEPSASARARISQLGSISESSDRAGLMR